VIFIPLHTTKRMLGRTISNKFLSTNTSTLLSASSSLTKSFNYSANPRLSLTPIFPKQNYNSNSFVKNENNSLWLLGLGFLGGAILASQLLDEEKSWFRKAYAGSAVPLEGVPGTAQERSFIAIKPDGVQRGIVGEIISRFETKGYKLVAIKFVYPTEAFAKEHYADLAQKPFFPSLVTYFSSGPVVAMVWEGKNIILGGRKLIGETNPEKAEPGSIRGDLCIETGRNIIHGSDSPAAAAHEIKLWFKDNEVMNFNRVLDLQIYTKT